MRNKKRLAAVATVTVVALIVLGTSYNRYLRRHARVRVAENGMDAIAGLIAVELDRHKRDIQNVEAQPPNSDDPSWPKTAIARKEKQYCQAAAFQIVRYEQYREELRVLDEPTPAESAKVTEACELVTQLRAKFELPHYRDEPRFLDPLMGVSNGELITDPNQIFSGPDK